MRYIGNILATAFSLYRGLADVNFYYYFVGVDLGRLTMSIFLFIDFYFPIVGVFPVPQWARYL